MDRAEKLAFYRQRLNEISTLVRVVATYDCQIERLIAGRKLPPFEAGLRDFIEEKLPIRR